jgi:hypothetical protein
MSRVFTACGTWGDRCTVPKAKDFFMLNNLPLVPVLSIETDKGDVPIWKEKPS